MTKKKSQGSRADGAPAPCRPVFSASPSEAARRVYLVVSAFCTGGGVMVLELAGNRVLAPWFGNSLYTWTGLIGVILVALSAGYYLGGYLADRRAEYPVLCHLMAAAAGWTLLVPVGQPLVEAWLDRADVIWGPVWATLLLLAGPGCLLAAVSPFAVRLVSLLSRDRNVGISAGLVGMCSTLGSVVGTFAAGFVLIPLVSLRTVFVVIGLVLGILATIGYVLFLPVGTRRGVTVGTVAAVLAGLAAWSARPSRSPSNVLFEQTTFYHRIRVEEEPTATGDRHRKLFLDSTLEGAQYVHSRRLPSQYQKYWQLARMFCPELRTAAFLGGGGFAMPEALLDAYPEAQVDVIEIDPAVIEVGRRFFRVDAYPRLNPVADDARRFLRRTPNRYDLVFGDVFHGVRCIPGHLVTREFFELVRQRLNERGVLMVDVGAAVEGPDAPIFQSVLKTLREVFAYQYVFVARPDLPKHAIQNIFLVAASHDLEPSMAAARQLRGDDPVHDLLKGFLAPDRYDDSTGMVFSDDWNPLEYLAAQTLRGRRRP